MVKIYLIMVLLFTGCTGTRTYKKDISSQEVKLCIIGDTGTGLPAQKQVAAELEKEKCHSIHFVGDIIYPNGISSFRDPGFKSKFYDFYYHLSQKDMRPDLFLILGNHDHKGSVYAWKEVAKKHPKIFFPHAFYLIKMNGLCITHFDTDYYKLFYKAPMAFFQSNWHKDRGQELSDCEKRIALTHHPYENRGKSHGPSSGWVRSFLKEHVIGKYDYLISGHEHVLADEGPSEGTRLLISGAGGNVQRGQEAGFLVLTWNRSTQKLSSTFRRVLAE